MKKNTLPPLHVLLFSLILIFQFSCSKDSDLLAEYVISETQKAILIDDNFVVPLNESTVLDVLANDTFESEEEVVITETSPPTNGSVEINSDNTLTYTPETTEETEDSFTYTTEVVNANETVSTETSNVTVTLTDDPNKTSSDVVNLLLNGTFENSDEWVLLNGSTATGGVLTMTANGNIAYDFPNWSAQYPNISPQSLYQTRRYRLTFTARQTSGTGVLQVGHRFSTVFSQQITGSYVLYTVDFNGAGNPAGNDLVFGGMGVGDVFEIQDVTLEDIGASTEDGALPSLPSQLTFYTDFETDQWGSNGVPEPAGNYWEVDHGLPRTTDHPDSPLKAGRDGTGRAIWLGSYNGDGSRNELGKDGPISWDEHWIGFSLYIDEPMHNSRIWLQERNLGATSNTVNIISLRESATQLYFSIADQTINVDQTRAERESRGLTWYGTGTGTSSVYFDYNTDEWIDIVIHYKGGFGAGYAGDVSNYIDGIGYDPAVDGIIEIWVNGEKIVDHTGTTVYRYDRDGGETTGIISPKIGPYWNDLTPTGNGFQGYYDEYKIWVGEGGTYEDVAPGN